MSTARERVQQEARRESDAFLETDEAVWETMPEAFRTGFLAGRTVSAEQIEQAARAITHPDVDPDRMGVIQTYDGGSTDEGWKTWRPTVVTAFTAAGFILEEE